MIISGLIPLIIFTVIITIPYSSIMEWVLHKYVMHRPVKIGGYAFWYPFEAHAMVHHTIFKSDGTYHLKENKDKFTIPMAWWNGPVLATLGSIPFVLISLFVGTWVVEMTAWLTIFGYYCTYEYIHWCMHLPKNRIVEETSLFSGRNGHHLLHHRHMDKNFNVVLPIADWLFGTLIKRAPYRFPQVNGSSVPDVQPIMKLTENQIDEPNKAT